MKKQYVIELTFYEGFREFFVYWHPAIKTFAFVHAAILEEEVHAEMDKAASCARQLFNESSFPGTKYFLGARALGGGPYDRFVVAERGHGKEG